MDKGEGCRNPEIPGVKNSFRFHILQAPATCCLTPWTGEDSEVLHEIEVCPAWRTVLLPTVGRSHKYLYEVEVCL